MINGALWHCQNVQQETYLLSSKDKLKCFGQSDKWIMLLGSNRAIIPKSPPLTIHSKLLVHSGLSDLCCEAEGSSPAFKTSFGVLTIVCVLGRGGYMTGSIISTENGTKSNIPGELRCKLDRIRKQTTDWNQHVLLATGIHSLIVAFVFLLTYVDYNTWTEAMH
jgi:hypothetical protein